MLSQQNTKRFHFFVIKNLRPEYFAIAVPVHSISVGKEKIRRQFYDNSIN